MYKIGFSDFNQGRSKRNTNAYMTNQRHTMRNVLYLSPVLQILNVKKTTTTTSHQHKSANTHKERLKTVTLDILTSSVNDGKLTSPTLAIAMRIGITCATSIVAVLPDASSFDGFVESINTRNIVNGYTNGDPLHW